MKSVLSSEHVKKKVVVYLTVLNPWESCTQNRRDAKEQNTTLELTSDIKEQH